MGNLIRHLVNELQKPLPGLAAQLEMAHLVQQSVPAPPKNARIAAVLALLYPNQGYLSQGATDQNDNFRLVFIQRSSRDPRDRHAGQISFPGGSAEPNDLNLETTALREAQEEVGVEPHKVQILGALSKLYIPVSNFLVHPFVGYTSQRPNFKPQTSEVDAILELPFQAFLDASSRAFVPKSFGANLTIQQMPCWQIGEHQIWGATAMITSEMVAVAKRQ